MNSNLKFYKFHKHLLKLLMMILIVFFSMLITKEAYSEGLNYNIDNNKADYNIEYILNGGTPGIKKPDGGIFDSVIQISNPTKNGYTFKGWTLMNGNGNTAKYGTSIDSVENLWNPSTKHVTSEYFKNLTNQNNGTVLLVANWELVDSNEDVILFNENMLKATTVTTLQQIGHPISDSNLQSINLGTPDTTIPAGDSNKIQMSNGSSYTATWDNVPYGNQNLKVKLTVKCITGKGKSYIYKDGNLIRVKWTDGSTNDDKTVRYTINFYKAGTNTAYSPTLWIGIVDPDESHYVFDTSGRTYYYKTAAESSDTVSWAQGKFTWPEVWDVQSSQFFYRYFGEQYDNPILAISNNTSSFTFDTVTPYNGFIKLVYLYLVTYDINFNGNGNTGGSMSNMTNLNYDQAYTLTQNAYTKTGYNFSGWNTKANGTGTSYSNGQSVTNLVNSDGSAVTLYAKWSEKTATLSYNANGHGTAPSNVTMKYTTATNAASAITGVTGYTFAGWNTKADGTGTSYAAGAQVKAVNVVPTATTLYAQWTANAYNIEYDLGGGTAGANQPTSGEYDSVVNISNPTKAGNVFTGWVMISGNTSTALYGETSSTVNNSWNPGYTLVTAEYFKNLRTDTGTVTLVANWMPYKVNIRILPNKGKLVRQHGSDYSTIVENDITYITKSGSKIIQFIEYGDRLLQGGLIDYNNASALNLERLGYRVNDNAVYINENTNQTYNQETLYQASDFADCSNGDQTVDLTVNWQPIIYNVTYDLDGGTNNPSNPTQFTIDTLVTQILNPEKTGYKFIGWSRTVDSLDWKTGYLNADTGLEEMDTQYENSYYSGYVSVTRGTTYTLSGYGSYDPEDIEWRLYYVEEGNTYFYGSSTGDTFMPTNTDHRTYKFRLILREQSTETQRSGIVVSGGLESLTKINTQSTGNVHLLAHWEANTATIKIKRNDSNWNNSGINVALYKNDIASYTYADADEISNEKVKWTVVVPGTYDVYASKSSGALTTLTDTGIDIEIDESGTATIDYYTLQLNSGIGISAVSGAGTYLKNQPINIDATVENGYTWEGWSVISGNSPE